MRKKHRLRVKHEKNKANEISKNETEYEKNQRFSVLVSWLHSYRYKNILKVFEELSVSNDGNPIRVVEIGCAHAKLYSLLNDRFEIDYIGIEPNTVFVKDIIIYKGLNFLSNLFFVAFFAIIKHFSTSSFKENFKGEFKQTR